MIGSFRPSISFGGGCAPIVPALNPATLALSGWYRGSYAGAPWAGTASAGSSGTPALVSAGANPSVDTAVNGFAPAKFNGTTQKLDGDGDAYDYFTRTAYRAVMMVNFGLLPAPAGPVGVVYNDPAIWCDIGNRIGIFVSSAGVSLMHAEGGSVSKSVTKAISLGWHVVDASYNGTTISIAVDGGAPVTQGSVGSLDTMYNFWVGRNTVGTFFKGSIEELIFAKTALATTPAQFYAYFKNRYPSAGLP